MKLGHACISTTSRKVVYMCAYMCEPEPYFTLSPHTAQPWLIVKTSQTVHTMNWAFISHCAEKCDFQPRELRVQSV